MGLPSLCSMRHFACICGLPIRPCPRTLVVPMYPPFPETEIAFALAAPFRQGGQRFELVHTQRLAESPNTSGLPKISGSRQHVVLQSTVGCGFSSRTTATRKASTTSPCCALSLFLLALGARHSHSARSCHVARCCRASPDGLVPILNQTIFSNQTT